MVTQKPMSVRMDNDTLLQLKQEASTSGVSVNRIINIAVSRYIRQVDAERRYTMYGHAKEYYEHFNKAMGYE